MVKPWKRLKFSEAGWITLVGVNVALMLFLLNGLRAAGVLTRFASTARNDPALGAAVPASLRPFLDSQKPFLVVTFGQCSGCTVKNLDGWSVMLER